MTMKVMIAEDEYLAKEELMYMLQKEKDIELCASAETGEELIDLYFEHKHDVLMLDIEIRGISGVEAASQILKSTKAAMYIMFIAVCATYAVDDFDIEAFDCLLNVFDQERFQKMLERLRSKRSDASQIVQPTEIDAESSAIKKLLIDDGEKMIVISPSSIYYAVLSDRMLEIYTEDKVIESKLTL